MRTRFAIFRPNRFDRMNILNRSAATRVMAIVAMLAMTAGGCAGVASPPDNPSFEQHLATKKKNNITVSVAVLTDAEAKQYFGFPLADKGVQAVWLKVRNQNTYPIGLVSRSMDPQYFSPLEVAYAYHRVFADERNMQLDELFSRSQFPAFVEPNDTDTGFVFTSRSEGAKFVNVEFWHGNGLTRDGFYMKLPSGGFDFEQSEFAMNYDRGTVKALDLEQLHRQLETMPCCTSNNSGSRNGDPVNFALIGDEDAVMGALTEQGWDPTHVIGRESVGKTVSSFLFGGQYRYSPVSPLFFFGRQQDLALQKVRSTIHQRNHLRLWLAPFSFNGKDVWVGQISRDIGVRLTWSSPILMTHKIDPDVDEAREYLVQDILASGFLESLGYVHGVGESTIQAPSRNLTGDPYFSDGLRAVMFVSSEPVPSDKINLIEWGEPLPTD
jgi:hypothetical protein